MTNESKPIPVEPTARTAPYLWKLTFWMKSSPNSGYTTAPLQAEECEIIKDRIEEKVWFRAPMAALNSAIVHYDGSEIYAFQIEKVIV